MFVEMLTEDLTGKPVEDPTDDDISAFGFTFEQGVAVVEDEEVVGGL